MKHENEFKEFLTECYSNKVVSDILSRCRRIEKEFSIILPTSEVSINKLCKTVKENGDKFGKRLYAYNQHTHALKTYYKFLIVLEKLK